VRRHCSRSSRPTRYSRVARSRSRGLKFYARASVRMGNKDYTTIIGVATSLPEENAARGRKLLTLYDLALTRTEAGT